MGAWTSQSQARQAKEEGSLVHDLNLEAANGFWQSDLRRISAGPFPPGSRENFLWRVRRGCC